MPALTRQQLSETQWRESPVGPDGTFCPVRTSTNLLGGKWKLLLLAYLAESPRRYGELKRLAPEISEKMLIQELRVLETDGLVRRTVHHTVPPRVDYELTPIGQELRPVVASLIQWSLRYIDQKRTANLERGAPARV